MLWSPDGTRLISGDARPSGGGQHEKAVLGVWKVDNRGRFSTICTYRRAATPGRRSRGGLSPKYPSNTPQICQNMVRFP